MLEQQQLDTLQEQLYVRFYKIARSLYSNYSSLQDAKLISQMAQLHLNENNTEISLGQNTQINVWTKAFVTDQINKRVEMIQSSLKSEFNYTPEKTTLKKMALALFIDDKKIL